jgi:hypothetical protein
MDNNEASRKEFEAQMIKTFGKGINLNRDTEWVDENTTTGLMYLSENVEFAWYGWQAAQQQSAGDIAELKDELNDVTQVAIKVEPMIYKLEALKAENERLRQTLFLTIKTGKQFSVHKELSEHQKDAVLGFTIAMEEVINEALSNTTSQSLQAHDDVPMPSTCLNDPDWLDKKMEGK